MGLFVSLALAAGVNVPLHVCACLCVRVLRQRLEGGKGKGGAGRLSCDFDGVAFLEDGNGGMDTLTAPRFLYAQCQLHVELAVLPATGHPVPTSADEIRPPDAVPDLFLVAQAGVGHEGLVQARSEELVA